MAVQSKHNCRLRVVRRICRFISCGKFIEQSVSPSFFFSVLGQERATAKKEEEEE